MHQLLFTMPPPPSSKPLKSSPFPSSSSSPNINHNSTAAAGGSSTSAGVCNHSPSATLDLLILILVLFSATFLLTSYFSYIFHSLARLLSNSPSIPLPHFSYVLGFFAFFLISVLLLEFCCGPRSRRCRNPRCKGLKKAMEFDLQLQTEDSVKSNGGEEIDRLPWKGGSEGNPDYECLRAELRKMAPPNGRAVLLFRARCGCPVAKLEGWGPKKGRRHKKALANVAVNRRDHR